MLHIFHSGAVYSSIQLPPHPYIFYKLKFPPSPPRDSFLRIQRRGVSLLSPYFAFFFFHIPWSSLHFLPNFHSLSLYFPFISPTLPLSPLDFHVLSFHPYSLWFFFPSLHLHFPLPFTLFPLIGPFSLYFTFPIPSLFPHYSSPSLEENQALTFFL